MSLKETIIWFVKSDGLNAITVPLNGKSTVCVKEEIHKIMKTLDYTLGNQYKLLFLEEKIAIYKV